MKKLFVILVALSLSLTVFATVAFAAEGEEASTPDTEIATEGENQPLTEVEPPEDAEDEAPDEVPEDTEVEAPEDTDGTEAPEDETRAEKFYSDWIDKITSSTLWVNLGTVLAAVLGIFAMIKSKFGGLAELVRSKADAATVSSAIKDAVSEISDGFNAELGKIGKELSAYQDNEKKMWAIITIFMTHAKISSSVKEEIMNRLTGIKDMTGSLEDIVSSAERAIEAAEVESKAEEPQHPALDAVLAEAKNDSDIMTL